MPIERFVVGPMGNNTYIVYDERAKEAAIVDPGMQSEKVLEWVLQRGLTLRYVLNTHGHTDHTYNDGYFAPKAVVGLHIHRADEPMLAQLAQGKGWAGKAPPPPKPRAYLEDGQELTVGDLRLWVIGTPGHTPGSVCLAVDGRLLTGDTLFQGSIGRFDFPGGSLRDLLASIKDKVFALPDDTAVLPGHGEFTTVGGEKENNPFVGRVPRVDLAPHLRREER